MFVVRVFCMELFCNWSVSRSPSCSEEPQKRSRRPLVRPRHLPRAFSHPAVLCAQHNPQREPRRSSPQSRWPPPSLPSASPPPRLSPPSAASRSARATLVRAPPFPRRRNHDRVRPRGAEIAVDRTRARARRRRRRARRVTPESSRASPRARSASTARPSRRLAPPRAPHPTTSLTRPPPPLRSSLSLPQRRPPAPAPRAA
jgi:hypothetical protein